MCFAPKPPKDDSAAIARRQEEERQARIREGRGKIDEAFGQFDDPFYQTQQQNYLDYYTPQLTNKFEDARRKLISDLSRTGNLQSGVGAKKQGDLKKAFDLQSGTISGQAIDYGNQVRTNVENARSDLYQQNQASADPSAAGSSAMARVGALSQAPALTPLGDVFAGLIDLGGLALASEARGGPGLKTGLFSPQKNAVRVVS